MLERTREEEARSRVDADRLRIAREVHDTVAHAIAIINVQAGVTAHVLDKRPERARETLVAIEQTSSLRPCFLLGCETRRSTPPRCCGGSSTPAGSTRDEVPSVRLSH